MEQNKETETQKNDDFEQGMFSALFNSISENPKTTFGLGVAGMGLLGYLLYQKHQQIKELNTKVDALTETLKEQVKLIEKLEKRKTGPRATKINLI